MFIIDPEPEEYEVTTHQFKTEPDLIEYVDESYVVDEMIDEYEEEIIQPTVSNIAVTRSPPKYQKLAKVETKFKIVTPKKKKEIETKGPFDCKKCGAENTNKQELQEHMKFHATLEKTEKAFKCEQCPKVFKNRYQLTLHNRSHSGEKPYECHICCRAFSMSSNLQKHIVSVCKIFLI